MNCTYSTARESMIDHCDRCITLLRDPDISYGLFNLFTNFDMPFGWYLQSICKRYFEDIFNRKKQHIQITKMSDTSITVLYPMSLTVLYQYHQDEWYVYHSALSCYVSDCTISVSPRWVIRLWQCFILLCLLTVCMLNVLVKLNLLFVYSLWPMWSTHCIPTVLWTTSCKWIMTSSKFTRHL